MKKLTHISEKILQCWKVLRAHFLYTILIGFCVQPVLADVEKEVEQLAQLAELKRLSNSSSQYNSNERQASETMPEMDEENITRAQAFEDMLKETNPLTPDQIIEMRKNYDKTFAAIKTPPRTPPRPTATSQFINLSPGTTPPIIRLANGFVSSLVFLDSTGAPWPILSYTLGDPKAFNVQWNKTDHVMMVQSRQPYANGNVSIRLTGLATPVMITIATEQEAVDYRVDFRVEGKGPNAQVMPNDDQLPGKENIELLSVLDGVPPSGGVRLEVDDMSTSAWHAGQHMFVRTKHKILSPGWVSSMNSSDGTRAYQMAMTSQLLVSINGKVRTISIKR